MSTEAGAAQKRLNISYFEGVNALVEAAIGKPTEFTHAENARSTTIGSIEKRLGQTVFGTTTQGTIFVTPANYGIFRFQNNQNLNGFYRISTGITANININVLDNLFTSDLVSFTGTFPPTINVSDSLTCSEFITVTFPVLNISVSDGLSISDMVSFGSYLIYKSDALTITESVTVTLSGSTPSNYANIYYINGSNQWVPLDKFGTYIVPGIFDGTYAEQCLFLVNQNDNNRYISPDGVTVVDSSTGSGHLFNSPRASKVNYYKQRLYLADFIQNGVRYQTTILRSSYTMGILALVNTDTLVTLDSVSPNSSGTATIPITDFRYFYASGGANAYEIWRGQTMIATMIVNTVNETTVAATITNVGQASSVQLYSSDEIWIAGTNTGPKIFRWANNPTNSGQTIRQYDTFKLAGGDTSPITLMENIGNIMLIANNFSMASWNDYVLEYFDMNIGCVSKRGAIKLLGTLYFLHYSGIYATTGSIPRLISTKVQRYISGATKAGKEVSAAGKKGTSVLFTLGTVTLYHIDGSVDKILSNVCLEYNTIQQNWFVHTNVSADDFETYVEASNTDRLMLTDTTGNHAMKEFLSGETDDGIEIPFRIDTMKLTLQAGFENLNNLVSLLVEVDKGSGSQVFIDTDDGNGYYPIPGNLRKGLSNIKIRGRDGDRGQPVPARLVSISIRDSSKQICKFSRMTLIFLPGTSDDNQSD